MMSFLYILATSLLALQVHAQGLNIGGPVAGGGITLGQPNTGGISIGGNPGNSLPPAPGTGITIGGGGGNPPAGGFSLGGSGGPPPVGTSPGGPVVGPIRGTPNVGTGGTPSGSGGVIVVDNDGTVIPGPGTAADNFNVNNNNNSNNNNNNNNNNSNNATNPGSGFGSGGFGSINFPDFSNFASIGSGFPRYPGSGNSGNTENTNLNSGIFQNPGFPNSAIPTFGNGNSNTNINNPPTVGNNNNNNANPSNPSNNNNGFPDLSNINFDFGLGNSGSPGFPNDFGSNGGLQFPPFPGSGGFPRPGGGGINLPPINTNQGGRFGEAKCETPTAETLPVRVDNTPIPENIVSAFFAEASVRPDIQVVAQFFNRTTGDAAMPKVEDESIACPANYSVLTRFVTSANAECWVVPPPTQQPIYFSRCRCSKCRTGGTVGRYSNNACQSKVTSMVVIAFCPLATPVKTLPMRIQIPTSCRCSLTSSNDRFNFRK